MNAALRTIARRQAGAFSRTQVLRTGVSSHELHLLLVHGEWLEVQPDVYACAGTPETAELHAWAAVLAVGPPVALGGIWAARTLRLDRAPEVDIRRPHLVVPISRRTDRLRGVDPERSRLPMKIRYVGGMPVLAPERALRQLAAIQPHGRVRDMTHHALRRRTITLTGLTAELGRGRPGAARLRSVLEEVAPGFQVVWEGRLHSALSARGLALVPQLPVPLPSGTKYLDLGDPRLRFGVEVDGLGAHLDRFAADRQRDRELHRAGWLVVHVAVSELADDLAGAAEDVAASYHRRAAELCTAIRTG
jgi:very-short-patch-repair endonuclease